jgi:mycoredoxin
VDIIEQYTIQMNRNSRITIYSTTWCGDCHRLKRRLDTMGVAYEEIDIDANPEAVDLVIRHNNGKRRVPTIFVDGTFHSDLPEGILKAA